MPTASRIESKAFFRCGPLPDSQIATDNPMGIREAGVHFAKRRFAIRRAGFCLQTANALKAPSFPPRPRFPVELARGLLSDPEQTCPALRPPIKAARESRMETGDEKMTSAVPRIPQLARIQQIDVLMPDDRDALSSNVVVRPWGSYESIMCGRGYQVKRIVVSPGRKLSLQYHHHRSEHWTVVEGEAHVTIGDDVMVLQCDESIYVPLGAIHRLDNRGKDDVVVIEVQCGDYLGEDDIVRIEDDFGRA